MPQIYRFFDKKNRLLYVGASLNAVARMTGHKTTVSWYGRIAKVKITSFRTMKAAYLAEQEAIRKERPLFNKVKSFKRDGIQQMDMNVEEVITFFGGVAATGRALGISQPSVSVWRKKKKIPVLRQFQIREVKDGKLRAEGK